MDTKLKCELHSAVLQQGPLASFSDSIFRNDLTSRRFLKE
jgi:hypothetical protein